MLNGLIIKEGNAKNPIIVLLTNFSIIRAIIKTKKFNILSFISVT